MLNGGGVIINSVGIPLMYYYGTDGDYNIMAIDILGPSMEDLINKMDEHHFTQPTVFMFAVKAVHPSSDRKNLLCSFQKLYPQGHQT